MASITESVTFVKTSDLLKIVDQLYIDNMEYARIKIHYEDSEILDGAVLVSGIPTFESEEPTKHYGFIQSANLPNCYE